MPKLYEYLGIAIYFWSNEHNPIHVHGEYGDDICRADIYLFNGKLLRIVFSGKLEGGKQKDFEKFVRAHIDDIVNKWGEFFLKRKHIQPEIVTKKI